MRYSLAYLVTILFERIFIRCASINLRKRVLTRNSMYQRSVFPSTFRRFEERQEDIWWEYVANFAEECLEAPAENSNGDHNFHEDCSSRVMDKTDRVFGWPEGTMESFVNVTIT